MPVPVQGVAFLQQKIGISQLSFYPFRSLLRYMSYDLSQAGQVLNTQQFNLRFPTRSNNCILKEKISLGIFKYTQCHKSLGIFK